MLKIKKFAFPVIGMLHSILNAGNVIIKVRRSIGRWVWVNAVIAAQVRTLQAKRKPSLLATQEFICEFESP